MFSGLTPDDVSAGLDAVVEQVLEEAGLNSPPVDAEAVAQALGITVATSEHQEERGRYVRLRAHRRHSPQATAVLRSEPRPERRHWALAHEIGEHVAPRVFAHLGVDAREVMPNAREALANRLAGRLLLPTPWFAIDAPALDWDLLALKNRYATASHELIARRMLEMPTPAIITIFDQSRLHFRRANVPGRVPPLSPVEKQCWQEAHNQNRPYESADGTCRIQAWPVHEEGWKREILRTEVELEPVG